MIPRFDRPLRPPLETRRRRGRTAFPRGSGPILVLALGALGTVAPAPSSAQPWPLAETATVVKTPSPAPPFGREDIPALEGALDVARAARAGLVQALEGPAPTELDEEAARRRLEALDARVLRLEADLAEARRAPSKGLALLREQYDELVSRLEGIHARLVVGPRPDPSVGLDAEDGASSTWPRGLAARALLEAEDELEALLGVGETLFASTDDPPQPSGSSPTVEDLVEDLHVVEERLAFAERIHAYVSDVLFERYLSYEAAVAEAIEVHRRTEGIWKAIGGTTAARSPSPANDPRELARIWFWDGPAPDLPGLRALWRARAGARSPLDAREHEGRLARERARIDTLELERSRLLDAIERRRAADAETSAPPAEDPEPPPVLVPSRTSAYGRLSERIERVERRLEELGVERASLAEALETIGGELATRREELEALSAEVEARAAALARAGEEELDFPTPRGTRRPAPSAIRRFVLEERLRSGQSHQATEERAVRRVEVRRDGLKWRIEAIDDETRKLRELTLPRLRERHTRALVQTFGVRGLRILAVGLLAWLLARVVRRLGERSITAMVHREAADSTREAIREQRARTLAGVFSGAARALIYLLAGLFVASQLDIDYSPLLVAAGGLSLAVGFGAQTLVRDFFAGFFILLEGHYSIGDVVEIEGRFGTVESLGLRTTVIRSLGGEVHTIPNGEIKVTTNATKLWSRKVVDVGVSYEEDADAVLEMLGRVGDEMREDPEWATKIRSIERLGVEALAEGRVVLRLLLETTAGAQWAASRELLRRIKRAADAQGIDLRWPRQHVVLHPDDRPRRPEASRTDAFRALGGIERPVPETDRAPDLAPPAGRGPRTDPAPEEPQPT